MVDGTPLPLPARTQNIPPRPASSLGPPTLKGGVCRGRQDKTTMGREENGHHNNLTTFVAHNARPDNIQQLYDLLPLFFGHSPLTSGASQQVVPTPWVMLRTPV